jgi:hypothetical protein
MPKPHRNLTLVVLLFLMSSCFTKKEVLVPLVTESVFEVNIDSNDSWMCRNVAFVLQDYPEYNELRGKRVIVAGEYRFIRNMKYYDEYTMCKLTYADDTTRYYSKYVFNFQYSYIKKRKEAIKEYNKILNTLSNCSSFAVDTIVSADTVQANGSAMYQSYVKLKGTNAPTITTQWYYNKHWARYELHWHVD